MSDLNELQHRENKISLNMVLSYLRDFMGRAKLFPRSKRAFVAVSGGPDSMALLFFLAKLKDKGFFDEVTALHVNHGTRLQNEEEELMVRSFAQELGVKSLIHRTKILLDSSDFENRARQIRYEFFKSVLGKKDMLYTGHHIDDSFEWSLLQQYKSSSLRPMLGIPLLNGQTARPFLAFSRKQIEWFVELFDIPFLLDESNYNLRYERNFLRLKVIPEIKKRFPSCLKHYTYRSNDLAVRLGVSLLAGKNSVDGCIQFADEIGGVWLIHPTFEKDFSSNEEQIISVIQKLSQKKRGILRDQVKKLVSAALAGKDGPMSFSGGVKAYITHGAIYFLHESKIALALERDGKLYCSLKGSQIPKGGEISKYKLSKEEFSPWAFSIDPSISRLLPSMRKVHPLWPLTTALAVEKGIWFNPLIRLLSFYQKAGGRGKKDYRFFLTKLLK